MSEPQPVRVIEIRVTEYALPAAPASSPVQVPELVRGYDPLVDSPLAGLGSLRYEGKPAAEPKRRRWFR